MSMDSVKQRYAGVQTFLKDGCLFLSLCSIAEELAGENVDVLAVVAKAKSAGIVRDDGYINDSCALLTLMTGGHWTRKIVQTVDKVADNEYTIEKWVRQTSTHFRRRYVDTLIDSQTVKNGVREAYYVYTYTK